MASPSAAPDVVQSGGQGLKASLLGASHVSSCTPWAVRGVLGERTPLHLWDEAMEGPISCWGGGPSSCSHSSAPSLRVGSQGGKHLRINIRANRPLYLPLIKPHAKKKCRAACWRVSTCERSTRCPWTAERAVRSVHVVIRLKEGATP